MHRNGRSPPLLSLRHCCLADVYTKLGSEKNEGAWVGWPRKIHEQWDRANSGFVGAASELTVAKELLERGCLVFTQIVGSGEVDLVCIPPNGCKYAIQVKKVRATGKVKTVNRMLTQKWRTNMVIRSGQWKPYRFIDFFVGHNGQDCWIFPASECQKTSKYCSEVSPNKNAWHLITGDQL